MDDIYEDLDNFDFSEELTKAKSGNKELLEQIEKLTDENNELKKKIELLEKKNTTVLTNISSLYKTAKLEIVRKDAEIEKLRKELDDLIFKRFQRSKFSQENCNPAQQENPPENYGTQEDDIGELQIIDECVDLSSNEEKDFSIESQSRSRERKDRHPRRNQSRDNKYSKPEYSNHKSRSRDHIDLTSNSKKESRVLGNRSREKHSIKDRFETIGENKYSRTKDHHSRLRDHDLYSNKEKKRILKSRSRSRERERKDRHLVRDHTRENRFDNISKTRQRSRSRDYDKNQPPSKRSRDIKNRLGW